MQVQPSPVRARLAAGSPQAQVLAPLALVLGSRAGLPIERIDELVLALELVVRGQPSGRSAELVAGGSDLEVTLTRVDPDWLEAHRGMLAVLVTEVEQRDEDLRLRVAG
jgi:hypothetical protein